jgi:Uma2 family endonuclease
LSGDRYVYPDLSAICGAIALEAGTNDVITNPQMVVEVLSTSCGSATVCGFTGRPVRESAWP